MPKYRVEVREVHVQAYIVEADTPEEALENAPMEGEPDGCLEYSHMQDGDTWTVEEIKDGQAG